MRKSLLITSKVVYLCNEFLECVVLATTRLHLGNIMPLCIIPQLVWSLWERTDWINEAAHQKLMYVDITCVGPLLGCGDPNS